MAEQNSFEAGNSNSKLHWNSERFRDHGLGTTENPVVAWLIKPDCALWKIWLCEGIMFQSVLKLGATTILLRHIIHDSTREKDYDFRLWRFRTDWHITVFIELLDGKRLQGDIYVRFNEIGKFFLMEDHERMDKYGKGFELWDFPRERTSERPVLCGGERLDTLMEESPAREMWLFDRKDTKKTRLYKNEEKVKVPRVQTGKKALYGPREPPFVMEQIAPLLCGSLMTDPGPKRQTAGKKDAEGFGQDEQVMEVDGIEVVNGRPRKIMPKGINQQNGGEGAPKIKVMPAMEEILEGWKVVKSRQARSKGRTKR